MKASNFKLITIFLLTAGLLSCVPQAGKGDKDEEAKAGSPTTNKAPPTGSENTPLPPLAPIATELQPTVAVKNFNQINNTFSKITSVSIDDEAVSGEYDAIMNQLPATNDPESLSPFNQIATTRLAFAYCDKFIESHNSFKDENYNMMSSQQIADKLLGFLLDSPADSFEDYANLEQGVKDILNNVCSNANNLDVNGQPCRIAGDIADKRSLTKMACAAIMSSGYITLI